MKIECMRTYGYPKLVKPKPCCNKNLIGSVKFSRFKPVQCKVWLFNGTIYVLNRDWFSECISFDLAEQRSIFVNRNEKFIYRNNFGDVILRNEAVISLYCQTVSTI